MSVDASMAVAGILAKMSLYGKFEVSQREKTYLNRAVTKHLYGIT